MTPGLQGSARRQKRKTKSCFDRTRTLHPALRAASRFDLSNTAGGHLAVVGVRVELIEVHIASANHRKQFLQLQPEWDEQAQRI